MGAPPREECAGAADGEVLAGFGKVYSDEWEEIRTRRERMFYLDEGGGDARRFDAPPGNLTGLALSGGGIRSATFSLGLLQGLHKLNLLRIFDYVSTVSGGGYVGGWWSAWLSREHTDLRLKSESPFLKQSDIKHPVSLILRIRDDQADKVAKSLRLQFRDTKLYGLISGYDEAEPPGETLLGELLAELNRWIAAPPHEGAPELEDSPSPGDGLRDAWRNRLLLESRYPYELLDIFPHRERIEPARSQSGVSASEGASSAWVDPIHHLRLFASYLTPRRGALSADTWRAVSVISRNLVLTWLVLLPVLVTVLLPSHIFLRSIHALAAGAPTPATARYLTSIIAGAQLFAAARPGEGADADADAARQLTNVQVEAGREAMRNGPQGENKELLKLGYIALVASFFVSLIVLMTILWLLTIRDASAGNSLALTMVCMGVVAALICAALFAFVRPETLVAIFTKPGVIGGAAGWVAVAAVLVGWAYWPVGRRGTARRDPVVRRRWERDLRRNRISRIHTKLMVWLTLTTVSLLLVAYGPDIVNKTLGLTKGGDGKGGSSWLGFLPVLSAVAGSLFTAFKARPSGGGERRPAGEPSFITRVIFAVTPGLVMLVLAVGAAWLGELLIQAVLAPSGVGQTTPLTSAALYYGGVLCFGLAVYEMDYPPDLKPTWPLMAFVGLLTLTVGLIIGTMIKLYMTLYSTERAVGGQSLWTVGLVVWPSLVMAVLLFHSLLRVFGRESWKSWLKGARLRVLVGLFLFGGAAAWWLLSSPLRRGFIEELPDRALIPMVGVATLAGSLILFRLSALRRDEKNPRLFDVRWWQEDASGRRPWAIWLLASVCLFLPVLAFNLLHEGVGHGFRAADEGALTGVVLTVLFVLALAVLPLALAVFGAAVAEVKRTGASKARGWALGGIVEFSSAFGAMPETTLGFLASAAVVAAVVVGFVTHESGPFGAWSFVAVATLPAGAVLSLAMLKSAVSRMPVEQYAWLRLPRRLSFATRGGWVSLWALGGACVMVALLVGYLTGRWVGHVGEYMNGGIGKQNALPVTLAGMAGCFTLTFFEIFWGRGQNRRTLWLIGFLYLILIFIFSVSLIRSEETPRLYAYTRFLLDMGGVMATVMIWLVALGWMLDPNGVSMHHFYKSRLVRAYLGASNPRRLDHGNDITEAAAGDDLPLCSLRNCRRGAPYHLINTTLNLVAGRDLATAQRSASSFVLSQRYCGSTRTAYRKTSDYMSGEMSLGTAVASSGAAVSPSMGVRKPTAALAMLMTLLNVRLGFWAPTPYRENWRSAQPRLWPFYLIREFLSQTNDLSNYCYLTDGGHFDNTGLYSLVERGCRYIVLVDCGADPRPCFSDLGDAIRRCRIDFGTEIKLDINSLLKSGDKGPTKYFVIGGVRYSRAHAESLKWKLAAEENSRAAKDARTGIIVYLKPSVLNPPSLGKETADVRQYAIENSFFPQQTTANQWFDEAQFESYRRLGQLIAKQVFESIKIRASGAQREVETETPMADVVRLSPKYIDRFFSELKESAP
jgi:hypothetical protein